jgi:hypothetical protein
VVHTDAVGGSGFILMHPADGYGPADENADLEKAYGERVHGQQEMPHPKNSAYGGRLRRLRVPPWCGPCRAHRRCVRAGLDRVGAAHEVGKSQDVDEADDAVSVGFRSGGFGHLNSSADRLPVFPRDGFFASIEGGVCRIFGDEAARLTQVEKGRPESL